MTNVEFKPWPKIARLFRDVVITEKLDGTNAAITITEVEELPNQTDWFKPVYVDGQFYTVHAQSRTRLIHPGMDNHAFAQWVWDNAQNLAYVLGAGTHFGEWWGSGIQRGYGLPKGEKRFSLFNTSKWADEQGLPIQELAAVGNGIGVVPTLYTGPFDTYWVKRCIEILERDGSYAANGFMNPEGVVTFHTASNMMFKTTISNDSVPKTIVG